jgi:hypothetical protein
VTRGDYSAMSNKKHSEETKKKIGKKSRGRKHTQATKRRLSELHSGEGNPMYGKPSWNRGVSYQLETSRHMSKKQRKLLSKIHKKRFSEGAKTWNAGKHTG